MLLFLLHICLCFHENNFYYRKVKQFSLIFYWKILIMYYVYFTQPFIHKYLQCQYSHQWSVGSHHPQGLLRTVQLRTCRTGRMLYCSQNLPDLSSTRSLPGQTKHGSALNLQNVRKVMSAIKGNYRCYQRQVKWCRLSVFHYSPNPHMLSIAQTLTS